MNGAAAVPRPRRAIPPAVLKELGSLELVARTAVDGVLHGAHRSDRPGFSQEFAEYRDYMPGDDLRFVDWNAYARTDRLYLKRFEGETNTRLLVMLDVSASMDVGDQEPSKLAYGCWLAAALIHIAARQHDAAGLLTFNDDVVRYVPPRPGRAQQTTLYHRLDAVAADGGSDWHGAFAHAARRLAKRGVIAAISDFYCDPVEFGRALAMLGVRGHDLIVFHVLDSPERKPSFGRNVTLRDAETGTVMEVDINEVRSAYPRRLLAHESALRQSTGAAGGHYVRMDADQPLDRALIGYLRFRGQRP